MQVARALFAGAVVVLALAVVGAAALPGVAADRSGPVTEPGAVDVAELSIQPGDVAGGTAELALEAQVAHAGNPTGNVSVRFRAIDAESGFVVAERRTALGRLAAGGWHPANASLRVEREGGYVLESTLFRDGRPVDTVRREVSGMAALTPAYARTGVAFTEQGTVPTVLVSVDSVADNQTELSVAASLTNEGDEPSGDLRTVVVVRQADSNVVAGEAETDVGQIRAGRTERASATVSVPSEYNYYVDVALYKDGVLVDTTRSVANLDPTERVDSNVTEEDVEFAVSDFESDTGPEQTTNNAAGDRADGGASGGSVPGFGTVVALAAVALAAAATYTRSDTDE
jgi:hypothetical protein